MIIISKDLAKGEKLVHQMIKNKFIDSLSKTSRCNGSKYGKMNDKLDSKQIHY